MPSRMTDAVTMMIVITNALMFAGVASTVTGSTQAVCVAMMGINTIAATVLGARR